MNELPSETTARSPDESRKRRRLVILVITLGLFLVAGFVVMVGTVIYRISNSDSQQNDNSAALDAMTEAAPPGVDVAGLQAELRGLMQFKPPAGAELIGVTSSGNRMTFHFRDDTGDIVVVFDLTSGKVLSRVNIPAGNAAGE
jgi:hypothetical protein